MAQFMACTAEPAAQPGTGSQARERPGLEARIRQSGGLLCRRGRGWDHRRYGHGGIRAWLVALRYSVRRSGMGWEESGQAWGERAADWAYLLEPYARRANSAGARPGGRFPGGRHVRAAVRR